MTDCLRIALVLVGFSLIALVSRVAVAADEAAAPYAVTDTIKLGGEGRWDYVRLNDDGKLLFVTRTTHVMVVDTATGKAVADIPGQQGNHGVALVPSLGRGFISDGTDGSVVIFDLKTYEVLGKIKAAEDADGILYDPASGKVLVVCGDAASLYSISPDVDPKNGKADPAVDLGGKPEYFATDGAGHVYVAINDKNEIAVLDSRTMKITARWPTAPGGAPTGMAIDAEKGRLFIGCRTPQKLLVMSTKDGSILADLPIGRGVDATAFDRGMAFASCGDGTLTVARETGDGKWEVAQTVKTPNGARTMAVDAKTGKIYLPTAETMPAPATLPGQPRARPVMVPGSFKIVVVDRKAQ